jgi:hypothetical protein
VPRLRNANRRLRRWRRRTGALIGGLAGGGKGALIGGLSGAGAGTVAGAYTGNRDVVMVSFSEL